MTSPNSALPAAPLAPHPTIPAEHVPDRRGILAFMSHTRREGDWVLPRLFRALSIMGNVEIDLSKALLAPGSSHIEVKAIMGNVIVFVPPDIRLECEVDAMVGSAEVKRAAPSTTSLDAPVVRITGTAILGSVEVKVIDPEAPSWLRRLRKRLARKSE